MARPLEVGGVERAHAADRVGVGRGHRLVHPEVTERRVGLALPPTVGVPHRLAVPNEEDAGHRRKVAR